MMGSLRRVLLVAVAITLATGCAAPKEVGERERSAGPRAGDAVPVFVEMDLAAAEDVIRSIQIYRTGAEEQLPIIELGTAETITLEFDLMAETGRPLSVYFYHADRIWRRDLSPAEYLESYQHDNVLDYRISTGTEVPYVHYTYTFPNRSIQFRISGNYIVRVTEQGMEEDVLFERAFFVTEQATALEFVTDRVLVGDYGYPSVQPLAQFRPTEGTEGDVFNYNVCFVRNGRFEMARCSDRPSLTNAPLMQFYLEPEASFEPEDASYFVDISNLRTSNQIASANFSVSPFRIELEPDYANFGSSGLGPLLNGQSRISSVVPGGEADIRGQYVNVRFAFVPPNETRLSGDVLITGSFNGWRYDPANRLEWVPERSRYEVELLLKQGQYEYRYVARDRRLARSLGMAMPRAENQYTALVYYDDVSLSTDRLVAVRQAIAN